MFIQMRVTKKFYRFVKHRFNWLLRKPSPDILQIKLDNMNNHDRLSDHFCKLGYSKATVRDLPNPFCSVGWESVLAKECWIVTVTTHSWALRHLRPPFRILASGQIDNIPTEKALIEAQLKLKMEDEEDGL